MLKVPGSNLTRDTKISYFCRNFAFFNFFQKFNFCHKKLPPLKPILTLQTWGQKCFDSDSDPFEITDFDLGHLVMGFCKYREIWGAIVLVTMYLLSAPWCLENILMEWQPTVKIIRKNLSNIYQL